MSRRYYDNYYPPYVPVAQRQAQARKQAVALQKKGQALQPVVIEGRGIASSFWGKAWCQQLEAHSDYANRLPRGRSYARNGAVIDLRVETGQVSALVSGSEVYTVKIDVQPLAAAAWKSIAKACSGQIDSLVDLLRGGLSKAVMAVVARPGDGLFPQPRQMRLHCSCPDAASMCKHVAAALYGVGARLDREPELLFTLRHVDPQDLILQAGSLPAMAATDPQAALQGSDLSALFGIDLGDSAPVAQPQVIAAPPPLAALAAKTTSVAAKAAKATKNAAPAKRARKPKAPAARKTVTATELLARGLPRHMIQSWLTAGVLLRTGARGVYGTTAQTERRIAAYQDRPHTQ
ncbi:MAG TPA: hypothetical protein VFL86_00950 [Burkholderiaceae bacterium]|nr:hypothetical protein [Burkholderiaceae bacterium]